MFFYVFLIDGKDNYLEFCSIFEFSFYNKN